MKCSTDFAGERAVARLVLLVTVVVSSGIVSAAVASAQEPSTSINELSSRGSHASPSFLTDSGRGLKRGSLTELSDASLQLLVNGVAHDVAQPIVRPLERRSRDSLLNGILIGAAIGGALFLRYYSEHALCEVNCQFVSGALGMIGIGAAVGAGIDALIVRKDTTDSQREVTTQARDPGSHD